MLRQLPKKLNMHQSMKLNIKTNVDITHKEEQNQNQAGI
jgi:hypothetical protein